MKGHSLERSKGFPKIQTPATRAEDDGLIRGGGGGVLIIFTCNC